MRLLTEFDSRDPRRGLAIDETLLESVRHGGDDAIRLWVNDPAIVVGRSQSVCDEVDMDAAMAQGIAVLRRISGGGTVYHYGGNLNATVALRDGRRIGSVLETFRFFGSAVAAALDELCSAIRFDENDLLIGEAKVGGAAQARRGNALLYHTTVLIHPPAVAMDRLLLAMRPGYRPRHVASRPRQTASLSEAIGSHVSMDRVAALVAEGMANALGLALVASSLTVGEERRAQELVEAKYGDDAWNRSL